MNSIHSFTEQTCSLPIPFSEGLVKAGFPSPATDYIEDSLDFNAYLVKNHAATFAVSVDGDSMVDEGIHSGDMLIVDRSLEPVSGQVVVAVLDGEFTVKKLIRRDGAFWLWPGNPAFSPIKIDDGSDFRVWGVVTHCIHRFPAGHYGKLY